MTEARTCKLHRTSSTVCRRHKPCATNRLTYFARQPVRRMRKGMQHAIIAFFARQRFFTSIEVNVALPRQPIKENETVAVTISFSRSAVRRGNEHLRAPERLSARYAITKRCPPIRCLHNRIELHLACLVLFYDIKVIVFSEKCKCVFFALHTCDFSLENPIFTSTYRIYILTNICPAISDFNEMVSLLSSSLVLRHVLMFTANHSPK